MKNRLLAGISAIALAMAASGSARASTEIKTEIFSAGLTLMVCFLGQSLPAPFCSSIHIPCR